VIIDIRELEAPSGQTVAHLLGVSANTISTWTKIGLPVLERGTRGKAHKYKFADCMRWYFAHCRLMERREPTLSTLPMVLLGDALMSGDGMRKSYRTWKPWALELTERLGYTEYEFEDALGELIENNLLDGAWQH
jgi:hypothetical protein